MADEEDDGDFRNFSTLVKPHPKGIRGSNVHDRYGTRGGRLYNWHQSRDAGFHGQELEAFDSNSVGYREGWRNVSHNGFRPAYCANKGSKNMDPLLHKNNNGFPKICRGHQSGYGVLDHGHNRQNSQFFGEIHNRGRGRNYVQGRGRGGRAGNRTHGRGYHYPGVSNCEDAESLHVYGEGGRKSFPDSGGKQVKNYHRGKRGGRGHFFRGGFKRVGVSFGNSKFFQSVNSNKVKVPDSSDVGVGATTRLECKDDGKVCSKELPPATKNDASIHMENEIQEDCPRQSPVSKCTSLSPGFPRSGFQEESTPVQEEDVLVFGDHRHPERAFISCTDGTRKRRRSSAVRDFPERSSKLCISVVKKVIIKSKHRKSLVSKDLVLPDSVPAVREVGSQSDLKIATETSSISEVINVPADCDHVDPELTFEECNKPHLGLNDVSSELVRSDFETMGENACEIILYTGNPSAEPTQANPENNIEIFSSSTLAEGNVSKKQVLAIGKVNNAESCTKVILPREEGAGSKVNVEIIKVELPEPDVQFLDRKDTQNSSQISCQSPTLLTHVKIPEAPDATTLQTPSPEHEHIRPKERKKNRRTEMQAMDGLLKSKSRSNKVDKMPAALTDGFHNEGHVSKKLKVQDSLELTKETGALIIYQGSDGGNMRNKGSGKRLLHKGSSRAKLFQTSKSLDPNDAANFSSLEASEGMSDRAFVKRTLHEFESIRKALVKSQDAVKRADLDAGALLREKGKWRNCDEKIVGEVPGVEVGDQFSFRMEMLIIGLHRQVQSGIDYISGTKRHNGSPLATSIVASGGYEDDKDDGNTLIYSGQGGNNFKGNKKQECNQELVRGNLALSNSMKEKAPVRVIRGTTDLASPSSKVYTYDGLYDVVNFALECGAAGFRVYQFTLTRRSGQPQVGLSFLINLKKKGLSRPNLLLNDISRGQERLPVCVVNEVDEEPAPFHFSYIPSIKYPTWYSPLLPQGCQCGGICDEEICSCAIKNGGEFSYNEKGYIVRDKTVVYECGPSCSCPSSCQNRVSQKGLRYRLEIFKTKNRGWGVRSMDSIQSGGFICEYTGELLSDAEAEQRIENDEYLFDLGNECNPSGLQSDLVNVNSTSAIVPAAGDVAYTIDAKDLGNVARFINHSCSPNLYAQNVLYDSDDLRFPHVMLFAMERIPPMRELTYDYNYSIDQVRDAHGNVKIKACYCGAQDCQGRLY